MKKHITENWRITITPDLFFDRTNKSRELRCKEIIEEIERHVDHVDEMFIECDEKVICEYCGYDWKEVTEDDKQENEEVGLPLCCNKAQEEFLKVIKN